MTLVDQFEDREIYDFVSPEDFPVLRYSLAEATIDDAICHRLGANSATQRKENLRIKYHRLFKVAVTQNIEAVGVEAEERQAAYLGYIADQEMDLGNPFENLTLDFASQPLARHLLQEEQVIIKAVQEVLFPEQR